MSYTYNPYHQSCWQRGLADSRVCTESAEDRVGDLVLVDTPHLAQDNHAL